MADTPTGRPPGTAARVSPPPLIPPHQYHTGTSAPPFPRLFFSMLDPLTRNTNLLPEFSLKKVAQALGLHPPLGSPARTTITLEMAPALDQSVLVPAGTSFATASAESEEPQSFTTLDDTVLQSAALITAGTTPRSPGLPGTGALTPLAKGTTLSPDHSLLLVLSRPLPGMTCQVTLPLQSSENHSDWASQIRWECWQNSEWVPCGTGTGLAQAPQAPAFIIPVPFTHAACTLAASGTLPQQNNVGLLRCQPQTPLILAEGEATLLVRGSVQAVQGELVLDEPLGISEGTPGQSFTLAHTLSTAYRQPYLEAASANRIQIWTMVPSFADSQPTDHHFMTDPAAGRIMFSPDPQRGGVPPAGSVLRIPAYHSGTGAAGNIPARSIAILENPRPEINAVFNPEPATGGTDARHTHWYTASLGGADSAATAGELERLALDTGLGITLARCLPARPQDTTPTVHLRVLPAAQPDSMGRLSHDQLQPAPDAQAAIQRRLGPYLPAGSTLNLTGFPLAEASVTVTVQARPFASPAECKDLARDTCTALYRYFCPLPGYGPTTTGWPVGTDADTGDIHRALADVRGLAKIVTAHFEDSQSHKTSDKVPVEHDGLLYSGRHHVICVDTQGNTVPGADITG